MNHVIQAVNFVGVLALVGLCVVQWKDNGQLGREFQSSENQRQEQATKIAEDEKLIRANAADLDELRNRLTTSDAALKQAQAKVASLTAERDRLDAQRQQLTTERDQFRGTLDKWAAAVKERDDVLKSQKAQADQLQADRNEAVNRYNDLVGKYNAAVKDLDAAHKAGYGR